MSIKLLLNTDKYCMEAKMIQFAVCDDDPSMLEELNRKITSFMELKNDSFHITSFLTGDDLLNSKIFFDVIFLDIQMPGILGINAAKILYDKNAANYIIFITALEEYVYDAFSVEAVDYLIKPIDSIRFTNALERVYKHLNSKKQNCLYIETSSWCKIIKLNDILYCEIIGRKIYIHTKQEIINYYYKLKQLEQQLDYHFFKCHRSYLVNLQYVCSYENDTALLKDGTKIPVSRLRSLEFKKAILKYIKKEAN